MPWPVHDTKAAVRFLHANASTYKINPDKLASCGVAKLEGADLGNASQSSRVIASVDWFGPINFSTMDAEAQALGFTISTNSATSPESSYIGATVSTSPELVTKANPATYISSDDAAFFIQHGSVDKNVPYTQSVNFHQALVNVKGASLASYDLISGAGHGTSEFFTTANLEKVFIFLDKHLK